MRHLTATLFLCLGTFSASPAGFPPFDWTPDVAGAGKHGGPPSGTSDQRKQTKVSEATERKNFYGSWIGTKGVFVWIEPGTFQMGSTPGTDPDRNSDEVQHRVILTRGFWMLDHEVTQSEYVSVMKRNPSTYRGNDNPVDWVQ